MPSGARVCNFTIGCTNASLEIVRLLHLGPRRLTLSSSLLLLVGLPGAQALSVSLSPSIPSPAPLGTVVTWTATAFGQSTNIWYRFRMRPAESFGSRRRTPAPAFQTIRDFGPESTLDWTVADHEGLYHIAVTARDNSTGETADSDATFEMTSRVTGDGPVITPTANPLVFLYSAPPCPRGSSMRVEFVASDGFTQSTPSKACLGLNMNYYLVGLRAASSYTVQSITRMGTQTTNGPAIALTTPSISAQLPKLNTTLPPPSGTANPVLLHSGVLSNTYATDLAGNVLWFYPVTITFMPSPEPGARFLALVEAPGGTSQQLLYEFDAAGTVLRETNAGRINEQLTAMGKRTIGAFHHEARGLPNGGVIVMATVEQLMTGVQGNGSVDVLGDMILALDRNFQVVWTWDTFDHLDPHRAASLGETCPNPGCPPLFLALRANDWTHGNALELTPDGNLLYSSRHQDWIIKINYANGAGNGDILWRLGNGGDFQMISSDPQPWFSHQHGPQLSADGTTLAVYDDGDLRQAVNPNAHSRGQVLKLDEKNRTATLVFNADLVGYSFALGNAQILPDGNYWFGGGWLLPSQTSQSIEFDPAANPVFEQAVSIPEYRVFRMPDLYTPPR